MLQAVSSPLIFRYITIYCPLLQVHRAHEAVSSSHGAIFFGRFILSEQRAEGICSTVKSLELEGKIRQAARTKALRPTSPPFCTAALTRHPYGCGEYTTQKPVLPAGITEDVPVQMF